MSGIERKPYTVGDGFNPDSAKHQRTLLNTVAAEHGEGFEIESYDPDRRTVYLVRGSAMTTVVSHADSDALRINIAGEVKASDAERYSASLADSYPGYVLTSFEPHRRRAIIAKLDDEVLLARDTLSNALRVKPWEIQVSKTDSGFSFSLPSTYMPSKHDDKLAEAAQMVGEPGWYVDIDIRSRTGRIVEAQPPTFEAAYPTPVDEVEHFDHTIKDHYRIPIGISLPAPGQPEQTFHLDLDAGAATQVGGLSDSGKSVTINTYLYHLLNRGAQVAIIDTPAKSLDFMWCKPYLMESGWGCDSIFHAATVSQQVLEVYNQRSPQMKREGVMQWKELPKGRGFTPLVLVVDEVTALYAMDEVPKANKDSPEKLQQMKADAEAINFAKSVLKKNIKRIAAEARFAGVFLLISTQIGSRDTGVDTALRTNLPNKILLGSNPTEANRALVFPDPDAVPKVPENIKADPAVAKGVGTFDGQGSKPAVFKSFFATPETYRQRLAEAEVVDRGEAVHSSPSEVIKLFGEDSIPEDVQL